MATKTKTEKPSKDVAPEPESRIVMPGGIHAENLETLEGNIDSRMAALLKDHQEMGARPK